MESEMTNDLVINGAGSSSGGLFRYATINGFGSVNGDIECARLTINGSANLDGNLKTKSLQVAGVAHLKGQLEAEEIVINGTADVHASVKSEVIKINGATTIRQGLTGEKIEVNGMVTVSGDCAAEVFRSRGSFTIDGLLNAGTIDISLHGRSSAKEIGGESIGVRLKPNNSVFAVLQNILQTIINQQDSLIAESIEGDEIYLEYTKAAIVRGKIVRIGPGCDIARVEYQSDYQKHGEARVGESVKIA